jgi:hypothetical protein
MVGCFSVEYLPDRSKGAGQLTQQKRLGEVHRFTNERLYKPMYHPQPTLPFYPDATISAISKGKEGVVFVLWGTPAQVIIFVAWTGVRT